MTPLLHIMRTLALSVWVGGIAFFAFGVAPVAFHVLPTAYEAGLVVGASLRVLHTLGFWCGSAYLLTLAVDLPGRRSAHWVLSRIALIMLMLGLTAYSAFHLLPRMERDRTAAGGAIEHLAKSAPARIDFDRLHRASERVEGCVLLVGLLTLVLTSLAPQRLARSALD